MIIPSKTTPSQFLYDQCNPIVDILICLQVIMACYVIHSKQQIRLHYWEAALIVSDSRSALRAIVITEQTTGH